MTERPDLRGHAAASRERIVGRHRAVVVEPHDLAEVRLHVLRGIELLPLARADPQIAVGSERDAMSIVAPAVDLRHLPPYDGQVGELAAGRGEHELCARHGSAGSATIAALRVAQ